jgi:hypothetical protein
MVKSPKLVSTIALVTGRAPETVKVALRRLREAKLVEVTGKGRGGKDMTAGDAAVLMLAVTSGETLKDSAAAIETYWNLRPSKPKGARWRISGPRPLKAKYFTKVFAKDIGPLDGFGTALTAVIQNARDGTLFPDPEPDDWFGPPSGELNTNVRELDSRTPAPVAIRSLNVSIFGPAKAARIWANFNDNWTFLMDYVSGPGFDPEKILRREYLETRTFSLKAIEQIGEGLR